MFPVELQDEPSKCRGKSIHIGKHCPELGNVVNISRRTARQQYRRWLVEMVRKIWSVRFAKLLNRLHQKI